MDSTPVSVQAALVTRFEVPVPVPSRPVRNPTLYSIWGLALMGGFAAVIVALSQYSDSDAGIIAVYAAGLVACAGGGVFIAFELERRRRFVYKVRLVALDLVAAVEFDNRTMLARRLGTAFTKLEPELRSRAAFEVIACIESQLLEAGAYRAATEIGDARRRVRACGKLADREVAG